MKIDYKVNAPITADQFIDVLQNSTLAERRPVHDRACMQGMVDHGNLTISAWDGDRLVGVARSVTDFHYACYLSDLAVDKNYQRLGIGKELQRRTQSELGPRCNLILLAAPAANEYYEHIGFENNPRCWILGRSKELKSS